MNGAGNSGAHLEMKWGSIPPKDQSDRWCPQLVMKWTFIGSPEKTRRNGYDLS